MVACGGPPSEAFGISLTTQGFVELRFGRCLGTPEISVRPAGDEWIPPVWDIVARDSRSGRLPPVVVVGDVPRGWRERTKLKHELEPGVSYTVQASSGEWYVRQFDFTIDELRPGYVLDFTHDVVLIDDFPTESACATRSPSDAS